MSASAINKGGSLVIARAKDAGDIVVDIGSFHKPVDRVGHLEPLVVDVLIDGKPLLRTNGVTPAESDRGTRLRVCCGFLFADHR